MNGTKHNAKREGTNEMNMKANATQKIECPKCAGEGFFSEFEHVHNGRCFLCDGSRFVDVAYIATQKNVVFNIWTYNEARNQHGISYRVKAGWFLVEKGRQTPIIAFEHFAKFPNCEAANKLVKRVDAAKIDLAHLLRSKHWQTV